MNEFLTAGVLLALFFSEATGLSPGGIIVSAYFCLFVNDPVRIIVTLIMGLIVWAVVEWLPHFLILYGQRRFALCVATGMLLKLLASALYAGALHMPASLNLSIGYLVPGIIARDFERQDFWQTIAALGTVTGILWLMNAALGGVVQ